MYNTSEHGLLQPNCPITTRGMKKKVDFDRTQNVLKDNISPTGPTPNCRQSGVDVIIVSNRYLLSLYAINVCR